MSILMPGEYAAREGIAKAEVEEIQVMYNRANDNYGVTRRGARFVCALPRGYVGDKLGVVPCDGRLIITHPNLPSLMADPGTGQVRTL